MKKLSLNPLILTLSIALVAGIQGCQESSQEAPAANKTETSNIEGLQNDLKQKNYFLVIEQTAKDPDRYQLVDKNETSGETRAILKKMDGTETILSNEELKKLAEAEAKKVEEGTSELTKSLPAESTGGLGLGEMILASAAGALIGGMIANKLAGNKNFQQRQAANTRPSARRSLGSSTRRSATPSRRLGSQRQTAPSRSTQRRPQSKGGFSFGKRKKRR